MRALRISFYTDLVSKTKMSCSKLSSSIEIMDFETQKKCGKKLWEIYYRLFDLEELFGRGKLIMIITLG